MKNKMLKFQALGLAGFFLIILSVMLIWVSSLLFNQVESQRTIDSYNRYMNFNNHLENFILTHNDILLGFSAYIETFDNFQDEEIYIFLANLMHDRSPYIRNIGILKDTTLIWNYPREKNAAAIGVDLSQIEGQSRKVLQVKRELRPVFQGPVNLVQGGIGYIIRLPFLKDGLYWGQASIVLDGIKFNEYIDQISKDAEIKVLILDKSEKSQIMYGNPEIIDMDPEKIIKKTDFGDWEIYYIPDELTNNFNYSIIYLVILLGIMVILSATISLYRISVKHMQLRNKNRTLNETAVTDRLTGVFNREMLERNIHSEIDRADRLEYDLSIILFDLDHFKHVNDNFGHEAGDRVLIGTAAKAKEIIRKSDLLVRWGGEEFLIIVSGGSLNIAVGIAEKLRTAISKIEYNDIGHVTISLGIAQRLEYEFWGSLFKRVDNALYKAKNDGRNRLSISMDSEPMKRELKTLDWKSEWFCSNNTINQQHKQLMVDANAMIDLFDVNPEKFHLLYIDFIESLTRHFRYEEGILLKAGYPFLDDHKEIHTHILNSINRTEANIDHYIKTPEALFDYILEEILVGHFFIEDFKFFNYL